jgi:hypothetical protein
VQSLQEEFARFATDLMQLKCEVISRHFEPGNILKLSNMKFALEDMPNVMQAIALIKQPDEFYIRVVIRPESVAMVDYAALQKERTEFLAAVSMFMQSSAPLIESAPASAPVLMEMLKWGVAGFKGSNQIEGVLDRAIAQMNEQAKKGQGQDKPDPEQIKAQAAVQLAQMKGQMETQKLQMQHQNEMQQQQMEANNTMKEIMAKLQADMAIINAKFRTDMAIEQMQAAADIQSQTVAHAADMASQDKALEVSRSEAKIPSGSDNE